MSWADERRRVAEERRERLAGVVPERGFIGWFDRGAWSAMAQDDPARISWPKAMLTVGAGIALALIIYATFFPSLSFVVGLAVAYAFLLWRARSVHARYLRARGRR
jgi:hypothetical protein